MPPLVPTNRLFDLKSRSWKQAPTMGIPAKKHNLASSEGAQVQLCGVLHSSPGTEWYAQRLLNGMNEYDARHAEFNRGWCKPTTKKPRADACKLRGPACSIPASYRYFIPCLVHGCGHLLNNGTK